MTLLYGALFVTLALSLADSDRFVRLSNWRVAGALLFGALIPFFLMKLVDRKPGLVLSKDGFTCGFAELHHLLQAHVARHGQARPLSATRPGE